MTRMTITGIRQAIGPGMAFPFQYILTWGTEKP